MPEKMEAERLPEKRQACMCGYGTAFPPFINGQLLESFVTWLHTPIWQVLPLHILDRYKRSSSSNAIPSSPQLTYQQGRDLGFAACHAFDACFRYAP